MSCTHPLYLWMRAKGWTTEDLSRALAPERDVSPESLRQIAHGYRRPSWDLAFAIEKVVANKKVLTAKLLRELIVDAHDEDAA